MSIPLAKTHPLAGLSGLWLMSEDRAKRAIAHAAEVYRRIGRPTGDGPTIGIDDHDEPDGAMPVGYEVVNGVATIPVVGVLTKYPMPEPWMDTWCGFVPALAVKAAIDGAMADARVSAVALYIDSPGGMVAGTSELVDAIAAYRASQPDKPIHAAVSDMAASGGYYIASQCRRITCNAMGEVGCIGVYAVLVDDSKFWGEMGITMTVVSSGGVKGLGADGVVSEELIADQQRGVDAMYERFLADVARGRNIDPDVVRKLGTGQTWLAAEALGLKLIDEVANADTAIAAIVGLTQTKNTVASRDGGRPAPQVGKQAVVSDGESVTMNPDKRAYLESIGLRTDATDDDATTFYGLLDDAHKKAADEAESGTAATPAEPAAAAKTAPVASGSVVAGLPDLIAACGGDKAMAADCAIAGMTVDQAKAAYGMTKPSRDALAAKDQQIARLQFEASGQKPVATGQGATGGTTDPEKQAKTEWAANADACRQNFIDEATYVATRKRELAAA